MSVAHDPVACKSVRPSKIEKFRVGASGANRKVVHKWKIALLIVVLQGVACASQFNCRVFGMQEVGQGTTSMQGYYTFPDKAGRPPWYQHLVDDTRAFLRLTVPEALQTNYQPWPYFNTRVLDEGYKYWIFFMKANQELIDQTYNGRFVVFGTCCLNCCGYQMYCTCDTSGTGFVALREPADENPREVYRVWFATNGPDLPIDVRHDEAEAPYAWISGGVSQLRPDIFNSTGTPDPDKLFVSCSSCDATLSIFNRSLGLCQCPPGSEGPMNRPCTLCQEGTFKSKMSNSRNGGPGAGQQWTRCQNCSSGTYTTELGATACVLCEPGKSPGELSEGTSYLGRLCELCPIGKFKPDEGLQSCTDCAEGATTNTSEGGRGAQFASNCSCEPGFGGTPREDCAYMRDATDGASDPSITGVPKTTEAQCAEKLCCTWSADADECIFVVPPENNVSCFRCTLCKPGTYKSKRGNEPCAGCEPGTYSQTAGSTGCGDCYRGYFTNSTHNSKCMKCEAGKIAPMDSRNTHCIACPIGFYSNFERFECNGECPPGWFLDPEKMKVSKALEEVCQICPICQNNQDTKQSCKPKASQLIVQVGPLSEPTPAGVQGEEKGLYIVDRLVRGEGCENMFNCWNYTVNPADKPRSKDACWPIKYRALYSDDITDKNDSDVKDDSGEEDDSGPPRAVSALTISIIVVILSAVVVCYFKQKGGSR